MTPTPYTLTPADVQTLRESVRWHVSDNWTGAPFAWITYGSADELWYVHSNGHVRCATPDPLIAAACLRCERAERGFIERILDRREPCTLASLAPDLAAAERARATAERLKAEHQSAQRAALSDRLIAIKAASPQSIDLDDLLR